MIRESGARPLSRTIMSSSLRAQAASSIPVSIESDLTWPSPMAMRAGTPARGWPPDFSITMSSAALAILRSSSRSARDRKSTSPATSAWKSETRRCSATVRPGSRAALTASRVAARDWRFPAETPA